MVYFDEILAIFDSIDYACYVLLLFVSCLVDFPIFPGFLSKILNTDTCVTVQTGNCFRHIQLIGRQACAASIKSTRQWQETAIDGYATLSETWHCHPDGISTPVTSLEHGRPAATRALLSPALKSGIACRGLHDYPK